MSGLAQGVRVGSLAAIMLFGLCHQTQAEKVGVAAAVNPDAFSSLAGAPQVQLNIGKSIFFNERINTTASGLVQVLLADGSTFTVGPGSDLVINKFVYDPKKGTGEITASFSKGVMRFVGGKISKRDNAVSINTPAGALAVRGCIILGNMVSVRDYGFVCVFCDYMKMKNHKIFMNGWGIFSNNGNVKTGEATPEILNTMQASLNPQGQNTAGTTDNATAKPGPNYVVVDTLSLQDIQNIAADKTLAEIINSAPNNIGDPPTGDIPPPPNPGGYAAGVVNSQSNPGFTNVVASELPQDFVRSIDQTSTTMVLHDVGSDSATSRYQVSFANDVATTAAVFDNAAGQYASSTATGNLINSAAAQFRDAKGVVTPAPALCNDCDFLEWGSFTTTVAFSGGPSSFPFRDRIDGWWVSGDLASPAEIDALWASNATATYNGHVLASVINNRQTYDATGNLSMGWNFASRSGELTISNFDGNRSFGTGAGNLTQIPGPTPNQFNNQFQGTLSGSGLTGSATGSFVRGPDSPAQGVAGDFHVRGESYRATGVFAGTQGPN